MDSHTLLRIIGISLCAVFTILLLSITVITADSNDEAIESGSCGDDATWKYNAGILNITGTGAMYDYYGNVPPWDGFRTKIKTVIIGEGIIYIGGKSFEGLTNMTSFTFSSTVETTGAYILRYCDSLTSLDIPGNVKSLGQDSIYDCKNLKKITLESGMKNLGDTIWKLPALEEITIPEGVEDMGYNAFCYCTSLKSVNFPSSLQVVRGFNYCDSLKSIVIPDNVTTLFTSFYMCNNLEHIELGNSVKTIYANTFVSCPIKYISFPASLRDISEFSSRIHFFNSDGSQEYEQNWTNLAGRTFVGTDGRNLYEWDEGQGCDHSLTEHPYTPATVDKEGNTLYYSCSKCGKYFSDAQAKNEIPEGSWIIPKVDPSQDMTVTINFVCDGETIAEPIVKIFAETGSSYDTALDVDGYIPTGEVTMAGSPSGLVMTYYYEKIKIAETIRVYAGQDGGFASIAIVADNGVVPDGKLQLKLAYMYREPAMGLLVSDYDYVDVAVEGGEGTVIVTEDLSAMEHYGGFFTIKAIYTSSDGSIVEESSRAEFTPE